MSQPTDTLDGAFDVGEPDQPQDAGTVPADDPADDAAEQLGDAGKKALDDMKGKWHNARDALKPWNALARELGVKSPDDVKALLSKSKADADEAPDPEKIRAEARKEARAEALRDRVLDKIEAKAAGRFADPEDARLALAGRADEFLDGDDIDVDSLVEALDDLLTRKPHLAANGRRFAGTADGGSRGLAMPEPRTPHERLERAFDVDIKTRSGRRA